MAIVCGAKQALCVPRRIPALLDAHAYAVADTAGRAPCRWGASVAGLCQQRPAGRRGGERGRLLRWSATTSDSTRCSRVSNSQMLTDSATPVRRVRLGVLFSRALEWPHLVAASQWLCPALELSRSTHWAAVHTTRFCPLHQAVPTASRCFTSRFTYQDMPLRYNPCSGPHHHA